MQRRGETSVFLAGHDGCSGGLAEISSADRFPAWRKGQRPRRASWEFRISHPSWQDYPVGARRAAGRRRLTRGGLRARNNSTRGHTAQSEGREYDQWANAALHELLIPRRVSGRPIDVGVLEVRTCHWFQTAAAPDLLNLAALQKLRAGGDREERSRRLKRSTEQRTPSPGSVHLAGAIGCCQCGSPPR